LKCSPFPKTARECGLEALRAKLRALGGAVERIAFFYAVTVNNPSCTIPVEPAAAGAARSGGQTVARAGAPDSDLLRPSL